MALNGRNIQKNKTKYINQPHEVYKWKTQALRRCNMLVTSQLTTPNFKHVSKLCKGNDIQIYIRAPLLASERKKHRPLKTNSSMIRNKTRFRMFICRCLFDTTIVDMRVTELRSFVRLIDAAVKYHRVRSTSKWTSATPQWGETYAFSVVQGTNWASFSGHSHTKIGFPIPCICTWLRKVPLSSESSEQNKEFSLKCRLRFLVQRTFQ